MLHGTYDLQRGCFATSFFQSFSALRQLFHNLAPCPNSLNLFPCFALILLMLFLSVCMSCRRDATFIRKPEVSRWLSGSQSILKLCSIFSIRRKSLLIAPDMLKVMIFNWRAPQDGDQFMCCKPVDRHEHIPPLVIIVTRHVTCTLHQAPVARHCVNAQLAGSVTEERPAPDHKLLAQFQLCSLVCPRVKHGAPHLGRDIWQWLVQAKVGVHREEVRPHREPLSRHCVLQGEGQTL